ncbi:MAG: hypothetical protein PW845_18035 [Pseudomonas sp.]|uniref:hypothetical protein n=1 Tax=Pseudomonas abieticivorans TaxID=2931382 RepID=UPI0020BE1216|nr:hypothetical protein [Pseudomonas sp. PIA16]MDE1167218.1 hypothetical protein [Pseudomonas sp.]
MQLLVTRRRHLGQALEATAVRAMQPVKGDLQLARCKVPCLGRETNVARVLPVDPLGSAPIPDLLEAMLTGMSTTGFNLTGIEEVEGALYAQSWWCREG